MFCSSLDLGISPARALSCLTLSGLILLVTRVSLQWINPPSMRAAWTIGAMWLVMTLTSEFVAGHYLFHTPWATLLADYNVFRGRLWILVLAATIAAPPLVYRAGQNSGRTMEISSPVLDDTQREALHAP